MSITVMPPLQRWRYKFLMKQKIVTVKLSQRRWNPATQNNLSVMWCDTHCNQWQNEDSSTWILCQRVIPCWNSYSTLHNVDECVTFALNVGFQDFAAVIVQMMVIFWVSQHVLQTFFGNVLPSSSGWLNLVWDNIMDIPSASTWPRSITLKMEAVQSSNNMGIILYYRVLQPKKKKQPYMNFCFLDSCLNQADKPSCFSDLQQVIFCSRNNKFITVHICNAWWCM